MAGIQEYLDKIKNAVYGREVRQAIHDAIQTCYDEGSAGSTDLTARSDATTALNAANQASDDVLALQTKTSSVFKIVSSVLSVRFNKVTNRDSLVWTFNVPEGYRIVGIAGWNFGNFNMYFARIQVYSENSISAAVRYNVSSNSSDFTSKITIWAILAKKDYF